MAEKTSPTDKKKQKAEINSSHAIVGTEVPELLFRHA